jgi:predicted nucleic acid-binding protein
VKPPTAVIDTNIVVAGLLTAEAGSPTARILDGMRQGAFPFLLSTALLAEYREVLLREKTRKVHGRWRRVHAAWTQQPSSGCQSFARGSKSAADDAVRLNAEASAQ